MLSIDQFYVKLPSDLTDTHVTKVRDILKSMYDNDEIDYDTFLSLCPKECRASKFYFLSKNSHRQTHNQW